MTVLVGLLVIVGDTDLVLDGLVDVVPDPEREGEPVPVLLTERVLELVTVADHE